MSAKARTGVDQRAYVFQEYAANRGRPGRAAGSGQVFQEVGVEAAQRLEVAKDSLELIGAQRLAGLRHRLDVMLPKNISWAYAFH